MKKAIITGVTGQDGSYLAKLLLDKKYQVIGIVRNNNSGKLKNLDYLGIKNKVRLIEVDLLDFDSVKSIVRDEKPDEIYNLAAQSSVGYSFNHPAETYKFNLISVLNLLEAIRISSCKTRFYQASSSEMYGKALELPITEESILNPISPYGTSKATAHWMVKNYKNAYGLFAVSGILFNHESFLRNESFFIKKILRQSIEISKGIREYLEVGNIDIKRDFGYSPLYVHAMWKMLQMDSPQDFVISSGQSICLKEIIFYVFNKFNISEDKIIINQKLFRPDEIYDIYGDNSKAKNILNWDYNISFFDVLDLLIQEEQSNYNLLS